MIMALRAIRVVDARAATGIWQITATRGAGLIYLVRGRQEGREGKGGREWVLCDGAWTQAQVCMVAAGATIFYLSLHCTRASLRVVFELSKSTDVMEDILLPFPSDNLREI